ncbi:MAG TPA: multicopper oxidase domain-containing protein [Gemmatimonadaceae bacterium]|nr:multicopper oxidase domain-containing protein [Gemmatimonadaceae bacterium]
MRPAIALVASMVVMIAPRHAGDRAALLERAAINDNRAPAGTLNGGVLTVDLEVREVDWRPDRDDQPGLVVRAFAERGKRASIPGPLIRVPEGTTIVARVTNPRTSGTLVMRGLSTRGSPSAADTVQIAAGATREVRFAAGAPGTYHYSGQVVSGGLADSSASMDAELHGAFVVDARGASRVANDRVLVIAMWRSNRALGAFVNRNDVLRFTINGKSWPNTERLTYSVGDTVRYRVINASVAVHPMHLHGFYFDVNGRGDGDADSSFGGATSVPRVVTERAAPGRTFSMTWVPERTGNWLFHCHDNFHVLRNSPLDGSALPPEHLVHVSNHALDMMGGLVMGIEVRGRDARTVAQAGETGRRQLRLVAQQDSGGSDAEPAYGYVLHEGASTTPVSSPLLPGPTIVLERGKPVSITVVNRLREPTAVHWHGIELESYFDGVADFSGRGTRIAKAIAPGDSFVARFTPPRSGTFMYHPHADENRQQQAGLSGTLLVVDERARFDAAHDKVVLLTVPRASANGAQVLINGSLAPDTMRLRAGERYRLRIVDVHTYRPSMIVRLVRDSTPVSWRAVAKDGMELSRDRATVRRAVQQLGNGETYDFELTPGEPADLKLVVTSAVGVLLAEMAVAVR